MRRAPEYIVMFLILMVTCSTYYLHWTHGPESHDHGKYRFRKHVKVEAHQDVSEAVNVSEAPQEPPKEPLLQKQPVSTTRVAAPEEVLTEDTIVVAVPTHNRIGYVQLTSSALKGTFPAEDIWIFDDKSSEYSTDDLLQWYGTEHVWQSTKRMKADAMARHILEWFLKTKYDVLVLLDSDLLVSPNWLSKLRDGLRESTGLLSLYRSGAPTHKSSSCGAVLCRQPSMGNAGTVWRRALVTKMLSEMPNRDGGFDWGWSEWCTKNKVPMEALKNSAVLHIGMHGSWSHETSAEKSVGFPTKELSAEVRQRAEHFLKGAKPTSTPTSAVETWQSFPNVWLPTYYQMAYANPAARTANDLEKVKQTCIKLGCVAVTVEQNGWLTYFRNIPVDKSKWEPKSRSTMWVMSKYLVPTKKQPDMKYGCSRHAHACRRDPKPGTAPCCAHVMLEIMSDMSRILRKHNVHWRLTQGQQLSVARDGMIQLWDHDFDPNFDQPEKAKAIIAKEMHLAGKASKYREADYYYTKRVAERLNTDWSKYKVMGGDFNWNLKEFHDPYALQRNPTFMDIGQNHDAKPTAETTFPCLPGYDILCSKRWFEETTAEFSSGYQRPPSGMPQEQIPYSGYVVGINNLMFDENGHERNAQSRHDTIRKYISGCPNFWEKPCLTSTKPQKSDILWVIPAFKRAWSLDLVLQSLSTQKNILVSKDADSEEIDKVLSKYKVDVLEHPWSCSRHPHQFPADEPALNKNYKGDTYGNPRSPWATCLKHHWWWMMKQAWSRKPERVCVLEDDTVIHPQAFEWLAKQKGNVKLTPEEIAVPWCMSAKEWQTIEPKAFCEHDDYNWDQTIAWMNEHGHGSNEAVVPSKALSMHVGDCGGWDAGGRDTKCTSEQIVKIRAKVEKWLGKPVAVNTIKKKWLTAHSKPNGGWGHPKDWVHCMGEKDTCLQWSNVGGCRHHVASDAWMCKFDWMSINTNGIYVSKGGSKIEDVLHRPENAEFVKLDNDAIGIPYIPRGPKKWHHKKLISAATTEKHNCEQTITGTTLFFERIEYANLWHTMNDWFNVHWTLETLGNPPQVTIVWLDGHARGHLDDAWGEIFSARTRYVSEFSGHVCFENAVWVPKNTPVWNTDMPSGRCGIMDRFIQRVLTAYGISASLTEDVVIDRKDYRAHPRHKPDSKNDRIIEHLDKMFPSSKVVQLEAMTFKEQVKLIAHTKRLRGVHGAGLTHLIWLPDGAEVVEWVAPSHASVKLFEHIATWRPNIRYSRAKMPRLQTPLVEKHRLTILIPFREKISDKKSQGSGREKNLRKWLEYMSSFLKMPADVIIVEQSQEGTFNKGFLFNVGFKESQNSDYFVLHDVDQIPEIPSNDYSFKKRPTHLLTSTSQWNYKKGPSGNVGGALMITRQKYQEINGYSNNFGGWGREDDNMALRLQKHGGYDSLPPKVGRYKELKHPRVLGLDETEQFHKNVANTHDFTSGLSDLRYETISTISQRHGSLDVKRIKVREKTKHHLNALSVREKYHDELSLSIGHRLKKYAKGPELHGNKLMERLHVLIEHVDITMKSAKVDYALHAGTLLGAWRHHGFIPWDTDIDVMIRADSLHGLIKHIEAVTGHDSIHWIIRHGLHSDIIPIKVVDKNSGYYVDIFICFVENNMCLFRWTSPPRKYPLHDWFPSRTCFFDHLKLQCPDSPQNILKHTYKNLGIPEKYKPYTSETFENVSWVDTKQNRKETIKTSDLFAAIDYNAQENKGPWKQGWDYDYDGRFKDGLTVHVVPHSHNDPGWIKTYHTYYSTQTRHILDTVVAALTEDPRRTFIWAEISYFSLWWDDASPQQKEQAKKLVAEKRLDFVTGGWVMNDEASVTARATRWHLQEGREWLQNTFGITPQYSWAIDPFGHSAGQAQVLKELGYKGMLIQRVHYAVKKQLAEKQQLEFQWQTPAGDIFTHMMPFYSYDGPHTCGPDPSVCCQFDFARINGGYSGCPWHKTAVHITDANVAERSKLWLDQVYKKAMLYKGKDVLIPIGDDFRYQTMDEAHKQFENYQKMFDWIGVHLPSVKVSFSTLTRYFDSVRQTPVPRLQGSFFPYSDRVQDYWTGYFNSRIFYKGYDRLLESLIAAVESKCPDEDLHMQKRALGLFQHHDGITGTAKSLVVQDYYQTMQKAVSELETMLKKCLNLGRHVIVNPLDQSTPTMAPNEIKSWQTAVPCQSIDEMVPQMTVDAHGMITALASQAIHETLVWRSNKQGHGVAGAYLMAVTGQEDVLKPIKHSVCGTSMYTELQTVFEMVTRRARVYKDGTIEILYDVDIHARNNGELWAVYKPEWSAKQLCSDLHGLTWECHVERKDAPLQSKFWPMPTMAWLASASKRMTWTGAQPTGVGLHQGAMILMLDRRGNKDDERGLGQGITDSRPVMMRFGVLVEDDVVSNNPTKKALESKNWMLNPEIELV